MTPCETIHPFVTLRKIEPDDLPQLYQWENDQDAWLDGDVHNPLSEADLRDYILQTTGDIFRDGQLRLMILIDSQTEPVGCVDLYDVDIRNRKAAVAIYLSKQFRGRGLALEALRKLNRYVSKVLCFRMLYALVREENLASLALFRAACYVQVATLPKWVNEGNICVLQSVL